MTAVQQTMDNLRALKLPGFCEGYERQRDNPASADLSFDERLSFLADLEISQRKNRKLKRLVASAKMPELATLEEVDFSAGRGLDKAMIASLGSCDFIRQNLNLIIVGPTGVGKTFLGCAIGTEACRQRLSVSFRNVSDLLEDIALADADGSTSKLKQTLSKPDLLILDDFGIGTINEQSAQFLLSIVDRRMRTSSVSGPPTRGTDSSPILRWLTPSSTGWYTRPTASPWAGSPCARSRLGSGLGSRSLRPA
jgi:DNA replication protein DnaC